MKASLKGFTSGKFKSGMMKGLETFYQRAIGIPTQSALPYEMLEHGIPYEVSKTYRGMKSEFECKRTLAVMEAHRQILRGF